MGTYPFIITKDGQAAVQKILDKYEGAVENAKEALKQAEARLGRFKKFIDQMDESERERLLSIFLEVESGIENNGVEEVI